MSIPSHINDGNWNLATISEVDLSYPFSDKGDVESWEASCLIMQSKLAYRTPRLADAITIPGVAGFALRGYLVDPGVPSDMGNGLFRFNNVYASIPATRSEPTTTVITVPIGIIDGTIATFTYTFSGYVLYEYALSPFDPLISLKVFQLGSVIYVIRGDKNQTIGIPPAGPWLADDSEVGIYKGPIFFRRSVYAVIPKTGFFS